jgi:transcriptional regulator with XRE-family HTH domain
MSVVSCVTTPYAVSVNSKSVDAVYTELGKRIASARKQRGLSQEELATASDLDRSHIGYLEQGRRRPTVSTLYKISRALHISLEQMFKGL